MSVVKFVNGYSLQSEEKTIYFVPTFGNSGTKRSIDLTILEVVDLGKDTGRKYYEGYKAQISDETLQNWEKSIREKVKQSLGIFEMVKKALRCCDNFGFKLGPSKEKPRILEFWNQNEDKSIISLANLKLETIEIVPSTGKLLETIVQNLQETALENLELRLDAQGKDTKQTELQNGLEELIRSKFRMEDRLYRAFTKVLNEKKKRIRELERRIRLLEEQSQSLTPNSRLKSVNPIPQCPKRKKQVLFPSSSEDEMMSQCSPEYERDTDILDSDAEIISKETPKSAKIKQKSSLVSSSERPTCSRKLFSSDTGQTVHDNEGIIRVGSSSQSPTNSKTCTRIGNVGTQLLSSTADDSETDYTDSSQEVILPKDCKVNKSNNNNSSHKLQNSVSQKANKQRDSINVRNLSQMSEPLTKKIRLAKNNERENESVEHENIVNDPNHILNKIFGSA